MVSNIEEYYRDLIEDLRSRKARILEEQPDLEEDEAIRQAIDEGLMYRDDQAYVLAHALSEGFIEWGKQFEWLDLDLMLFEDINKEA